MLVNLIFCLMLIAVTASVHAFGLVAIVRWVLRARALDDPGMVPSTWLLVRVLWCLIALHGVAIAIWAVFYWWRGAMPDIESALYFSSATYATIGYGDLVLPKDSRFFGSIEGLTGILLCGLSTGFFFAVVARILRTASSLAQAGAGLGNASRAGEATPSSSSTASATEIRRPK